MIATEAATGNEVVLHDGDVVNAVLASSAIPGIFPSVIIDGRELVDGGVSSNTPIGAALRLGAKRLIVFPTGFSCALRRIPRDPLGRTMHALSLVIARQLVADLERWIDDVPIHLVPPLCPVDLSPYDYSNAGALIERSAESTRGWIVGGGLGRRDIAASLREHTH